MTERLLLNNNNNNDDKPTRLFGYTGIVFISLLCIFFFIVGCLFLWSLRRSLKRSCHEVAVVCYICVLLGE